MMHGDAHPGNFMLMEDGRMAVIDFGAVAPLPGGLPIELGMMHGDAHPGNFMLLDDGRMAVIDFGAVAPLPDGLPVELGTIIRLARDKNYNLLLPTMEKVGFIQKGEQVSVKEIDDMLRQYVEPIRVEVFHYTRKWLQKMAAANMAGSVEQIKTARQMDLPAKLAIPLRVIASIVAISAQLDAHVPVRALTEELIPGFAEPGPAH
jgi:predicted unusual protein kinase regulating ubiquinone biosynthesis (AarF/ABC1/UbiB family)